MKKLISFLMALIAAALAANASAPVQTPPSRVLDIDIAACDVNQDGEVALSDFSSGRYDVNSDGIVNYIDYACIYYTITWGNSMPTEDQCDFDGNGKVNVNDWVLIFDAWKNGTNEDPFDLNHDGSVDYDDLGMMALLLAELDANASAGCYLYIEDFEVKQSEVGAGTEIVVPVKAHFDAMVGAWQVFFDLPEGLTAVNANAGSDMSISYFDENGVEQTYHAALAVGYDCTRFISANMEAGYWQDPNGADPNAWVFYGVVKWLAGDYDEMLPQAVEAILETGQCSVSMLQRRVKLGYSRAARIVDQMEELGIVGPYEGAKPRSVLVDRNGWIEIQAQLGIASDSDLALAAEMNEDNEDY